MDNLPSAAIAVGAVLCGGIAMLLFANSSQLNTVGPPPGAWAHADSEAELYGKERAEADKAGADAAAHANADVTADADGHVRRGNTGAKERASSPSDQIPPGDVLGQAQQFLDDVTEEVRKKNIKDQLNSAGVSLVDPSTSVSLRDMLPKTGTSPQPGRPLAGHRDASGTPAAKAGDAKTGRPSGVAPSVPEPKDASHEPKRGHESPKVDAHATGEVDDMLLFSYVSMCESIVSAGKATVRANGTHVPIHRNLMNQVKIPIGHEITDPDQFWGVAWIHIDNSAFTNLKEITDSDIVSVKSKPGWRFLRWMGHFTTAMHVSANNGDLGNSREDVAQLAPKQLLTSPVPSNGNLPEPDEALYASMLTAFQKRSTASPIAGAFCRLWVSPGHVHLIRAHTDGHSGVEISEALLNILSDSVLLDQLPRNANNKHFMPFSHVQSLMTGIWEPCERDDMELCRVSDMPLNRAQADGKEPIVFSEFLPTSTTLKSFDLALTRFTDKLSERRFIFVIRVGRGQGLCAVPQTTGYPDEIDHGEVLLPPGTELWVTSVSLREMTPKAQDGMDTPNPTNVPIIFCSTVAATGAHADDKHNGHEHDRGQDNGQDKDQDKEDNRDQDTVLKDKDMLPFSYVSLCESVLATTEPGTRGESQYVRPSSNIMHATDIPAGQQVTNPEQFWGLVWIRIQFGTNDRYFQTLADETREKGARVVTVDSKPGWRFLEWDGRFISAMCDDSLADQVESGDKTKRTLLAQFVPNPLKTVIFEEGDLPGPNEDLYASMLQTYEARSIKYPVAKAFCDVWVSRLHSTMSEAERMGKDTAELYAKSMDDSTRNALGASMSEVDDKKYAIAIRDVPAIMAGIWAPCDHHDVALCRTSDILINKAQAAGKEPVVFSEYLPTSTYLGSYDSAFGRFQLDHRRFIFVINVARGHNMCAVPQKDAMLKRYDHGEVLLPPGTKLWITSVSLRFHEAPVEDGDTPKRSNVPTIFCSTVGPPVGPTG